MTRRNATSIVGPWQRAEPEDRCLFLFAVAATALVVAATGVWLGTPAEERASATAEPLPATLQRELDGLVSDPHVGPGAVAAVLTPEGVRSGSAGLAELSPRRPMRPDDRVRVASITKT
jgi:CubicO group peptidase (beta-lactamase class C family)